MLGNVVGAPSVRYINLPMDRFKELAIAQMKSYYAVFRDSSMANDSVATNFEQIFETYSPDTVRKVL
mgnify:CR=1 FL=1